MNNITWQHPNSKGDRNEAIYGEYQALLKNGLKSYEIKAILSKEWNLSPQRIYAIYHAMVKKINKLNK